MVTNPSKTKLVLDYQLIFSRKENVFFESQIKLDMEISRLAISGEIGSGKSCFLKIIAGIIQPDFCRITFGNLELTNSQKRKNIPLHQRPTFYLWQEATLFPHLSVSQNLFATPNAKNFSDKEELFNIFGIQKLMNKTPKELSGGEKQKICLLQALLSCPKLLLLDEPFSCLDSKSKANLMKVLIDYQDKYKIAIIYVSHSSEELKNFGIQKIVLKNGKIENIKK